MPRARSGITRPAQVVQWRSYHDDLPRAAVRAVVWPMAVLSFFWLRLVNPGIRSIGFAAPKTRLRRGCTPRNITASLARQV